jgi:hypothetical protein
MTTTTTATTTNTSVSTLQWDSAYMASFDVVNKAIENQQSYPQAFQYTDVTGITISGKWTTWQLTPGGAGGDVQLACTVTSGSASGAGQTGDLANSVVVIQVRLAAVAAAAAVTDPTAKTDPGTPQQLQVNTQPVAPDPAVSIISSSYPAVTSQILIDLLDSVFKDYFNNHIGDFTHVFAVMNINEVADQDGFQWLKPTAFDYAVASPLTGATTANSAFGLIAMVQGHPILPTMQLGIDVSALANLPDGANSAFVINESLVAQNMLLRGAIATIQGSQASDFGFSSDGLSVVNLHDLTWGNFQSEDKVISPVIPANNFVLRADDTYVYLEISNANYETSPGVTVHMNVEQKFTFKTVKADNGNWVFVPDTTGLGSPSVTSSVSLSEGLQITEIVMGAIAAVAGVLCVASAIGSALAAGAEVSVDAASNAATMTLDADAAASAIGENPAALATENDAGAAAADDGAAAPEDAAQTQKCGVLTSTQFRLITGLTGAVAGAVSGSIGIAKAATALEYDKIPAFDTFAANCLGASAWPGLADYTLMGASFRTSLVMGIKLNTSPA